MSKKFAVIGLGNIARRHRRNIKELFPGSTVIAMSASGREPGEEEQNIDTFVHSLEALIDHKPDYVIVASPASLHQLHAVPLIQAGIPVLVEKPIAATLQQAQTLVETVQQYETPAALGYCLRYKASSIKIKALLADNAIGQIYNINAQVGQFLPTWREFIDFRQSVSANAKLGGGALLELSHELDYLYWFFGRLTLKHAYLRSSEELGLDVEDIADVVLTDKTGALINLHLDFLQKTPNRSCSFIGSKGRIEWNLLDGSISVTKEKGQTKVYSPESADKNQMYLAMLTDFVEYCEGHKNRCVDLQQGLETVALIDQIKQQAMWGKRI